MFMFQSVQFSGITPTSYLTVPPGAENKNQSISVTLAAYPYMRSKAPASIEIRLAFYARLNYEISPFLQSVP